MGSDLDFVKYPKKVKPIRVSNVNKDKKLLINSTFVDKKRSLPKPVEKKEALYYKMKDFFKSKEIGKKHPLTEAQKSRIQDNMSPKDLKNVEVITYKMLKIAEQFTELWLASEKVTWHRSLHGFMIDELNDLSNEIVKAQSLRVWPVIDTKKVI